MLIYLFTHVIVKSIIKLIVLHAKHIFLLALLQVRTISGGGYCCIKDYLIICMSLLAATSILGWLRILQTSCEKMIFFPELMSQVSVIATNWLQEAGLPLSCQLIFVIPEKYLNLLSLCLIKCKTNRWSPMMSVCTSSQTFNGPNRDGQFFSSMGKQKGNNLISVFLYCSIPIPLLS